MNNFGVGFSAAWDLSLTVFTDRNGNDTYQNPSGSFAVAAADHNAYAVCHDAAGDDVYPPLFNLTPSNSYHGGFSFSAFIDAGAGDDVYADSRRENNRAERNTYNGVFVDQ